MKFLLCPKCGIRRFYVKDEKGNNCLVQVTTDYVVIPVHEGDSLEGFDTETLIVSDARGVAVLKA